MVPIEPIRKYGITLRPVEAGDAEFIVRVRTDLKRGRFISATSPDVEQQRQWILRYKEREARGEEFYFICEYDGVPYGTTRIYDLQPDSFEVGSWVFVSDTPPGVAILADIAGREFAFGRLGASKCRFEVRKENLTVVRYHKSYRPVQTGEDELNYYFELTRSDFDVQKEKLTNILAK